MLCGHHPDEQVRPKELRDRRADPGRSPERKTELTHSDPWDEAGRTDRPHVPGGALVGHVCPEHRPGRTSELPEAPGRGPRGQRSTCPASGQRPPKGIAPADQSPLPPLVRPCDVLPSSSSSFSLERKAGARPPSHFLMQRSACDRSRNSRQRVPFSPLERVRRGRQDPGRRGEGLTQWDARPVPGPGPLRPERPSPPGPRPTALKGKYEKRNWNYDKQK